MSCSRELAVCGDAACVILGRGAALYTFHGNPDRIRRTVGERNVSRILPSRLADPVLPWRQSGCSLFLFPHLPRRHLVLPRIFPFLSPSLFLLIVFRSIMARG